MKKQIISVTLVAAAIILICVSFGVILLKYIHSLKKNELNQPIQSERFILIQEEDAETNEALVYDKDTKVIYVRVRHEFGYAYCPYYCIDMNGNAVIAIYNGEEDPE